MAIIMLLRWCRGEWRCTVPRANEKNILYSMYYMVLKIYKGVGVDENWHKNLPI